MKARGKSALPDRIVRSRIIEIAEALSFHFTPLSFLYSHFSFFFFSYLPFYLHSHIFTIHNCFIPYYFTVTLEYGILSHEKSILSIFSTWEKFMKRGKTVWKFSKWGKRKLNKLDEKRNKKIFFKLIEMKEHEKYRKKIEKRRLRKEFEGKKKAFHTIYCVSVRFY